jgi:hypothetical protein
MKRLFALLVAASLCLPTASSAWWQSIQQVAVSAGGGGYVGPGDITSGASHWYGLRAYNAAYAAPGTNPALNITDQSGGNALTVNILATGALDVGSVSSWLAAHPTITSILVTQIYDQVGTNHLSITLGNAPALVLSGLGSKPVLHSTGEIRGATVLAISDPYTISTVARRTSGTNLGQILGVENANGIFFDGSGTLAMFDGGGPVDFGAGAVTENTFHTIQGVFNGASSIGQFDATITNPLSATTGGGGLTSFPCVGNSSFIPIMDWVEGGIWASDQHANFNSINSNAHAFWGF